MLFAQQPFGMSAEERDWLAFWSDILGVVGFVLSLITIGIAVFVERKIAAAKVEAKRAIDAAKVEAKAAVETALADAKRFIVSVTRHHAVRELSAARLSMELAREACRSKQWVRALGHLDAATAVLLSLINSQGIETAWRDSLREALDGGRAVGKVVRGRAPKGGPLTDEQLDTLDDTIQRIQAVEARFINPSLESSP